MRNLNETLSNFLEIDKIFSKILTVMFNVIDFEEFYLKVLYYKKYKKIENIFYNFNPTFIFISTFL